MRKTIITTTIALAYGFSGVAQELEYAQPKKLGTSVNSDAEEVMPLLTNDGKTLYYVRAFHPDNSGGENTGHDIWTSNLNVSDSSWSAATNLAQLNNEFSNGVAGISTNGQTFYLMNYYEEGSETLPGLSKVTKTGDTWSTPERVVVPGLTPSTRLYGFYVSPDERTIIFSMETESSIGKEDLYVSTYDDLIGWTNPIHMGSQINSEEFEISPFLSPDGTKLYFSSDKDGGFGDADIYVSERIGSGWTNWSTPENLGSRINSGSFDAYFTILADSTVYFASSREGDLSELYRSKLQLKPQPVVAEKKVGERPTLIFFEFDKSYLTDNSQNVLDLVSDTLSELTEYKVILEGHADHKGTDEYNIRLGERRANSAKDYLSKQGVDVDRMTIQSYGESQPMAPNTMADGSDNPEGRALNRRVVIRLVKPEMAETSGVDELLK